MNKLHQDDVRKKIQVSLLLKKLQEHALSDDDEQVLSVSKMKAIEILLRKSLPDLSAITLEGSGEDGAHKFEIMMPWLQQQVQSRNQ